MIKIKQDMRAKTITLPTYDELYDTAPQEIKDYIDKCVDTPQGTDWHPEGCVDIHNRLVYDRARATGDMNLAIAAFFHDLGKVDTTAPNKRGGWSAHGHERFSAKLVSKYNVWIKDLGADPNAVFEIVNNHMRVKQMDQMRKPKREALMQNKYYRELQKFTKFDDMRTLTDEEINRYK